MRKGLLFWLAWLALALALSFTACGSSAGDPTGPATPTTPQPDVTPAACADGFHLIDDASHHAGCEPTLPKAACAAGTAARVGADACVPVGVTACAKGFTTHASGWGCDAVLPSNACPAGTRERLGSATCEPVTDCNAPFPPPGATLFVKASYTAGEVDASHFLTVTEALAAAAAGATIAVDAGAYKEKLTPTKSVTIIGRCPEQVVFSTGDGTGPGLRVENVDVIAKNMTFRGFQGGVAAFGSKTTLSGIVVEDSVLNGISASNAGTVLTLSNVVVRGTRLPAGNNQSFGLVAQKGAKLEVDDSVIADNDFANVVSTGAGVATHVTRSIIRDGRPPTTGTFAKSFGVGFYVSSGGSLNLEESAVIDNAADGIVVSKGGSTGAAASGKIVRSVVRGTKFDPVRAIGRGIEVGNASTVVVEQTTSFGNADIDLLVTEGGNGDLHDSTTFGSEGDDPAVLAGAGLVVSTSGTGKVRSLAIVSSRGVGVQVQDVATLDFADSLVLGTRPQPKLDARGHDFGFGMTLDKGSTVTVTRSTIERASTVGLLSQGGTLTLDGALVRETQASRRGESGRGISAQDGAKVTILRSAVMDNLEMGIVVIDGAGSLTLTDSTVANTKLDPSGGFGIGVLLAGGVTGTISSTTITGSEGIGFASSAAGGLLSRSTVSRNNVGIHVQDGASLIESDTASDDRLAVAVSKDTQFVDNKTRVGSGTVPLPQVLTPGR
ncbi:MAG: putative cell surface protein [Myxococcaceae bacterium]|nr:putative cell surface protein [Myxococcaceae bacterium]